jgi:Zn-dependent protease
MAIARALSIMFASSFPLVKLFGIELRLHWSSFVIFTLILTNLAMGVFPAWHPQWSSQLAWEVALGTTLLFFASIVAHELAHALVARAYDIPVSSIVLFLFGGIADLEEDPDSPKKEGLMAGVGPLVSLVLGAVFWLLASALAGPVSADASPAQQFAQLSPLATLLGWLGPINIFIGLFNLLPGFPLDGGRVLRSLLWAATGDLTRATRWAARAGQGFGAVLMLFGILMALGSSLPIFGSGLGNGLWLLLIGWFLYTAAIGSYSQLLAKLALRGRPVSSMMRRLSSPVRANISVEDWVRDAVMTSGAEQFAVVDKNGRLLGIVHSVSARRVAKDQWASTPVSALVEPIDDKQAVELNDDCYDAFRKLQRAHAPELLVLDGNEPVGAFGLSQVARWLHLVQGNGRGPGGPFTWTPPPPQGT